MVAPSYPIIAALVPPPVAIDPRRGNHPTEGVAALDPQLDTPVELAARRTAPPIGAPSSPVAPSILSPLASARTSAQLPIQSPLPKTENRGSQWPWGVSQAQPSSFSSVVTEGSHRETMPAHSAAIDTANAEAVAEASAHDILNESLESLKLGPTVFDPNARPVPPMLPSNHQLFQTQRHMSPYEQSKAVQQKQFQNHAYPHEGRTIPNQSPTTPVQDGAHRSRSILLRNLPPGIDDESLRRLLENYGPLRELGAQHRARGGRGSVIATYFDLRHARDAVNALDNSIQFGRRVEARFQCPAATPPPPPSPRQARNGIASPPVSYRQGNGSTPRYQNGKHSANASSPAHRPMNGDDAKPSVSPSFAKGRELRGANSPGHSPSKQATQQQPVNQGTLVVFNLDPSTTAEEIRDLFGSIGDVKEIRGTPNKKHHKFVEFFDVRDAQRALVALNKTELGGKKIKIEISRPGGRVNAVRNSAQSSDPKPVMSNPVTSHSYVAGQTPPSLALAGASNGGHTNHSQFQNQSNSPLDGRPFHQSLPLSPFSTPFSAPFMSNEGTHGRRMAGHIGGSQNVNPGPGNTYPTHGHPVFSGAAIGAPTSPSNGFYNNLHQRQASPFNSLNMHEGNGHRNGGPDGSSEGFHFEHVGMGSTLDVDPQAGRSFDFASDREMEMYRCPVGGTPPTASMFDGHRNGTRSAWSAFSAPTRRTAGLRGSPDIPGVPGNVAFRGGLHAHGEPHSHGTIGSFLGHGSTVEGGYDFLSQSRDDGLSHESPRFSPLTSARPRNNAAFGRVGEPYFLEPTAHTPGSSHDMFGIDAYKDTTPNGKDRGFYGNGNVAGTVSPFPAIGATTQASPHPIDRPFNLIGNDGAADGKDGSKRKNLFGSNSHGGGAIGMHMNGHDSGPRRSSPSASRSHGNMNGHGTGSSFGNHSNAKFALNIARVMSGEDTRTALMIRNIPNKYNQRMLLAALEEHHRGHFDFIYLPIDFKNKCNVGYAFINFTRTEYIPAFYDKFHGRKWGRFNSEKVCEITYARIQGKSNLIGHFQNSSLMNEDPKCRPVVFDANGKQEEFPVGPNVRTKRGPSVREAANRLDHSPPFSPRGRCN